MANKTAVDIAACKDKKEVYDDRLSTQKEVISTHTSTAANIPPHLAGAHEWLEETESKLHSVGEVFTIFPFVNKNATGFSSNLTPLSRFNESMYHAFEKGLGVKTKHLIGFLTLKAFMYHYGQERANQMLLIFQGEKSLGKSHQQKEIVMTHLLINQTIREIDSLSARANTSGELKDMNCVWMDELTKAYLKIKGRKTDDTGSEEIKTMLSKGYLIRAVNQVLSSSN